MIENKYKEYSNKITAKNQAISKLESEVSSLISAVNPHKEKLAFIQDRISEITTNIGADLELLILKENELKEEEKLELLSLKTQKC